MTEQRRQEALVPNGLLFQIFATASAGLGQEPRSPPVSPMSVTGTKALEPLPAVSQGTQ